MVFYLNSDFQFRDPTDQKDCNYIDAFVMKSRYNFRLSYSI